MVINSSNGTTHIFNLSKNQRQNQSPVIKNDQLNKELLQRLGPQAAGTSGGIHSNAKSAHWVQFMQQQLEHLQVVNLESICKIKYAYASQSQGPSTVSMLLGSGQGHNQVYTDSNEGMIDQLIRGAQGAGLVSQLPELSHLVTNIRQEWDKSTQTYQY